MNLEHNYVVVKLVKDNNIENDNSLIVVNDKNKPNQTV